jgi:hypothetical protein
MVVGTQRPNVAVGCYKAVGAGVYWIPTFRFSVAYLSTQPPPRSRPKRRQTFNMKPIILWSRTRGSRHYRRLPVWDWAMTPINQGGVYRRLKWNHKELACPLQTLVYAVVQDPHFIGYSI